MRSIAHISDLHFGAESRALVDALAADLHAIEPSLVVISGDFTQRARRAEFRAAREFLDRIPRPQLGVPGNHDVPLFDVFRRFISPLGRYRRFISDEVDPVYADDEWLVVGLNTARSATWKSGRISHDQMKSLERHLEGGGERVKIVVTHHPFIPPADDTGIELVGRAVHVVEILDRCRVDLLLAGHLHRGYAADIRTHYPAARRAVVSAQAGTAVSVRLRHNETNSYNVVRVGAQKMEIEVRTWNGVSFATLLAHRYQCSTDGWHAVG